MELLETLRRTLSLRCPSLELRMEEPMSRHTTFRIGGPAAMMALPKTREEAAAAVRTAAELGISPFFLGSGSNLLVSDRGVKRFLVKTTDGMDRMALSGKGTITAESGVSMARLSRFAKENCLTGLEFAGGIPGSLGGGVTMNAGAYGGEMAQVVTSVIYLEPDGEVRETRECEFGYRHSAFSDGRRMILGAILQLQPGDRDEIQRKAADLAERRREKQPLEYPSAGSVFKRPEGYFAAALIDQCGLKGLRVGGAQVSEKHAGFIVNRGGATCADVMALAEQVRERVLTEKGVTLEMEIKVLE